MTEQNSSTMSIDEATKKAVTDATDPGVIRQKLVEEAERQLAEQAATKVAADIAANAKAIADQAEAARVAAAATAPKTPIVRKEVIDGMEFEFSGESELEVERMVTNALKVASALRVPKTEPVSNPAAEEAARVAVEQAEAAKAAAKAELELKFKRGEISTQDYIEQSGAIEEYLAKQGVPLEDIRASVESNRSRSIEHSWEQATQAFVQSAAGADWPGGEKNLQIIGLKLQALGLVDADDKAAALAQAYESMKQDGLVFSADAPATPPAAPPATPPAAPPAAPANPPAAPPAAPVTPRTSSSLFGVSSGTFGAGSTEKAIAKQFEVPANATGAEIIQLWKEYQILQGKDPNAAFQDTFGARRA